MANETTKSDIERLLRNPFIQDEERTALEAQLKTLKSTPSTDKIKEANTLVLDIKNRVFASPLSQDGPSVGEWEALIDAIDTREKDWKKTAWVQFYLALLTLPVFAGLVLAALVFDWFPADMAATVAAICGTVLVTIAAHSYLVFRIHQQAGLAAERLSEKKVGLLFLRTAMSRKDKDEAAVLLKAGTSMFLGHHTAETIPLSPDDKPDFTLPKEGE